MKCVLVVVGSPGVGKSTTCSLLALRFNGLHVDLNDLVKCEGLSSGFDKKRETLIADVERVSERVEEIIRQYEGCVIVDGHFAMDVVPPKDASFVFVLRRTPDELREILRSKGFRESKVAENVAAEILDVCLFEAVGIYGEERVCEIDFSGRSIEEVVEEITDVVEGRRKCRVGLVDWLGRLESEGRLTEFLDASCEDIVQDKRDL